MQTEHTITKKHYTQLIEIMREGVLVVDKDLKVRECNKAFIEFSGLRDDAVFGVKIDTIIVNFLTYYTKKRYAFESKIITKNGEKSVLVNISDTEDELLITLTDISEFKQQERQLLEQSKQAQMGEMINMIAHQWRQPINTLSAIAIRLEMKSSMEILELEEVEETAKDIQRIVQDMSSTIDDFLNFSKRANKKTSFSIYEIIQEILKLMQAQLNAHTIELSLDIDEALVITSYRSEVKHILLNLIANARDVLDEKRAEGKELWVRAYAKDSFAYIEVEDNAGGIDKALMERIFEPYFTTKEQGKGTGLGLYMSKRMAKEQLHGKLKVENSKKGAKFMLQIPFNTRGGG